MQLVTLSGGGIVTINGGAADLPYDKDGLVIYSDRPYAVSMTYITSLRKTTSVLTQ